MLPTIMINIDPNIFNNVFPDKQLKTIKEKWIINLSSVDIPTEIQYLSQLGEKFSLPTEKFKKHDFINFIKQLEDNLSKLHPNTANDIRIFSVHELSKLLNSPPQITPVESQILRWYKSTVKFVKDNPDIIIT